MTTPTQKSYIRNQQQALRPYIFARMDMLNFLEQVLGASILARYDTPIGAHIEAQIDDSILVLEVSDEFPAHISATVSSLYLYVADVDATYARALSTGAASVAPPEDKPYDERQCGISDSFGNTWWISTYIGDEHP